MNHHNSKSLNERYREKLDQQELEGWALPSHIDSGVNPMTDPSRSPFSLPDHYNPYADERESERDRQRRIQEQRAMKELFNQKNLTREPKPPAPTHPLGAPTTRDALLAQTLGSTAAAFEKAFGNSVLALLITEAKQQRSLPAKLAEQLHWAIDSGASLPLLAKLMPLAPLEIMRLGVDGLAVGSRLLELGLELPAEVSFQSASGRKALGTPLHALFTLSYANCAQLGLIARALATPERLAHRDSEGYSACGRLNLELANASAHKAYLLSAFEALVSLGADPSDLAPGPVTLAADPAIARAAEVELERKALDAASRTQPSPGVGSRL